MTRLRQSSGMHFDLRLWRLTAGLRDRISWAILLGLASLCVGIARFAFLGRFLAGMAAAAIGLNLATGIRLGRRNVRDVGGVAVAAGTAVALGVLRLPLPMVLAGIIPLSFAVVWLGRTK